ncbi:hypothetical protein EIMP300_65780 [Escherichia coli]|uniref:Uncharacterized protein n=1 Tax=Escherichia coli TaxID=562 RepID=A0A8S0FZT4_ECOLX|nr:hypothetical protein EIMP300_65780 [Escherichia coli]
MVINYKQLREKREQVKESFRRNEDLTPLVRLAQGIVDAYEISLELPSQTWTDSDGNRQHYVSCGLEAAEGFRRMPLSQIPVAPIFWVPSGLRLSPLPPKHGAAMMSEN